ncbi:hypothetical protein PV11_08273 [Exophiala sideris]|uniref:Uncharacterized protein n=1 Tax=Exophiala sideris TaxID=1016849 RepID=A0A0D1YCU0_9EURO|nr:hypothetical protein PV11_08273 [Exophiala sideris]
MPISAGTDALCVPSSSKKIEICFPDDYVDAQKLREVLQEHYPNEDFKLKWSADQWWLKARPRQNGDILSKGDLARIRL